MLTTCKMFARDLGKIRKALWTSVLATVVMVGAAAAGPSAIHCSKFLDVRAGKVLVDQVVVFDAAGITIAVGPAATTKLPDGIKASALTTAISPA